MLVALEANLKRGDIVHSDIAKMFLFFVNLKATKLEIVQGVKLLKEAYPEDVDLKLIDEPETVTFLFVRETNTKSRAYRRAIYFLVS